VLVTIGGIAMCGRYVIEGAGVEELSQTRIVYEEGFAWHPSWNAAPSQILPVIMDDAEGDQLDLVGMRWGLVPRWTKPGAKPKFAPINARSETVSEKGMFRHLVNHNRVIVPASGFYEWKRSGTAKQPYYIQLADERMMWFAGLWDEAKGADEHPFRTYTILTTEANAPMQAVHDRMPVILTEEHAAEWLSDAPFGAVEGLLLPAPDNDIVMHPVSPRVNSPRNNDPELVEPIEQQEDLLG